MSEVLYSFRETSHFTKQVLDLLTDDEYTKLQWRLIEFPDAGDVIKGRYQKDQTGGKRKGNSWWRPGDILLRAAKS
jgi:hypothetical protein